MEGWQVVTADNHKLGHVVAKLDDYLIVEMGHLKKSSHPLPITLANVREQEQEICVNLPKGMLHDSPRISGEDFDREEVARYYGLAAEEPEPEVVES